MTLSFCAFACRSQILFKLSGLDLRFGRLPRFWCKAILRERSNIPQKILATLLVPELRLHLTEFNLFELKTLLKFEYFSLQAFPFLLPLLSAASGSILHCTRLLVRRCGALLEVGGERDNTFLQVLDGGLLRGVAFAQLGKLGLAGRGLFLSRSLLLHLRVDVLELFNAVQKFVALAVAADNLFVKLAHSLGILLCLLLFLRAQGARGRTDLLFHRGVSINNAWA